MKIELIYDSDCPNIEPARTQLTQACAQSGTRAGWQEWNRADANAPDYIRRYGSPTILVNGKDVSGDSTVDESSCRVYAGPDGVMSGVPSVEQIANAIAATNPARTGTRKRSLGLNATVLTSVGIAMLPKLACPACWPAYAGLMGAIGLGFLIQMEWLLPLTGVFLVIALFALAFRARRRHGYGPLLLGSVASAIVMLGKFGFDSDAAMYTGLAALVGASLWNTWSRQNKNPACPNCVETT